MTTRQKNSVHKPGSQPVRPARPTPVSLPVPVPVAAIVQRAVLDPTSLTPPELLHLQRIVGNSALNRLLFRPAASAPAQNPIQRAKLSRREVRSLVSWALAKEEPNSTAVLLAIYNSLRLDIPEQSRPPLFNSLSKGAKALQTAGMLDQEDIAALERWVKIKIASGEEKTKLLAEEDQKKIEIKYSAIESKYAHHIFVGDFNDQGQPTGYHSTQGESSTHQAYGTKTDVNNQGAYQQSVKGRTALNKSWLAKTPQSTFFPDTATPEDVITAIASVYGLGYSSVQYPPELRGMELTKKGTTVFPAGGDDHKKPEPL